MISSEVIERKLHYDYVAMESGLTGSNNIGNEVRITDIPSEQVWDRKMIHFHIQEVEAGGIVGFHK